MKLSAKAEYACLAVLDLALRNGNPDPLRVTEIAERNAIPERFLVQILLQLKAAGFVRSVRGAGGGYHLAVPPEVLNVWDVIQLVDGACAVEASDDVPAQKGSGRQLLHTVWREVNHVEEALLKETSFARLVELSSQQDALMFYI